ncbi:MAG: hypothetical protein JEY79_19605, partial [Pseudodesulfovibrio sp.]|nr:hypothetical protein [Pseudodesulfovibrio sp.]
MSIVGKIASLGIGEIASGIGNLARDIRAAITGKEVLSAEAVQAIESKLLDLQAQAQDASTKLVEAQASIIVAEAQGESWLQRNWRPVLMMSIVAIVVNNYLLVPYGELFFPGSVKVLELPEAL